MSGVMTGFKLSAVLSGHKSDVRIIQFYQPSRLTWYTGPRRLASRSLICGNSISRWLNEGLEADLDLSTDVR